MNLETLGALRYVLGADVEPGPPPFPTAKQAKLQTIGPNLLRLFHTLTPSFVPNGSTEGRAALRSAVNKSEISLDSIWSFYDNPYGHELRLSMEISELKSCCFVPFLSALQIYPAHPLSKEGELDMEAPEEDKNLDPNEPLYEFFERTPPVQRKPLASRIREDLAKYCPLLTTGRLKDLNQARSWFAVFWQPVLSDLVSTSLVGGAFLTFHSFELGGPSCMLTPQLFGSHYLSFSSGSSVSSSLATSPLPSPSTSTSTPTSTSVTLLATQGTGTPAEVPETQQPPRSAGTSEISVAPTPSGTGMETSNSIKTATVPVSGVPASPMPIAIPTMTLSTSNTSTASKASPSNPATYSHAELGQLKTTFQNYDSLDPSILNQAQCYLPLLGYVAHNVRHIVWFREARKIRLASRAQVIPQAMATVINAASAAKSQDQAPSNDPNQTYTSSPAPNALTTSSSSSMVGTTAVPSAPTSSTASASSTTPTTVAATIPTSNATPAGSVAAAPLSNSLQSGAHPTTAFVSAILPEPVNLVTHYIGDWREAVPGDPYGLKVLHADLRPSFRLELARVLMQHSSAFADWSFVTNPTTLGSSNAAMTL